MAVAAIWTDGTALFLAIRRCWSVGDDDLCDRMLLDDTILMIDVCRNVGAMGKQSATAIFLVGCDNERSRRLDGNRAGEIGETTLR